MELVHLNSLFEFFMSKISPIEDIKLHEDAHMQQTTVVNLDMLEEMVNTHLPLAPSAIIVQRSLSSFQQECPSEPLHLNSFSEQCLRPANPTDAERVHENIQMEQAQAHESHIVYLNTNVF